MKRTMHYGIILIAAFVIGVFAWMQYSELSFLPKETGKTWVQIDSVSCLGNSWEQDWLSSNNRTYEEYPRNSENEIITAYYNKQGITIFSVKTKFTQPKFMCTACSCGNGYTFYLLILDSDVGKMLSYGYKVA